MGSFSRGIGPGIRHWRRELRASVILSRRDKVCCETLKCHLTRANRSACVALVYSSFADSTCNVVTMNVYYESGEADGTYQEVKPYRSIVAGCWRRV
jgi:hypothetical protein